MTKQTTIVVIGALRVNICVNLNFDPNVQALFPRTIKATVTRYKPALRDDNSDCSIHI